MSLIHEQGQGKSVQIGGGANYLEMDKQAKQEMFELACEMCPQFEKWCQKTFEFPQAYYPLSALRETIANGILIPQLIAQRPDIKNEALPQFITSIIASQYDFPFYLVSENMLTALRKSRPPRYWDRNDVKLGFPCIHFVLPKNQLFGDNGEPISILAISAPTDEELIRIGITPERRRSRVMCTATSTDTKTSWYSIIPVRDDIIDLEIHSECTKSKFRDDDDPIRVAAFTQDQLFPLLLQLVMIFHIRPESVEEASLLYTKKSKHGKHAREFWSPRFLGRKYQFQREGPPEGTHASPEFHWRIGHYRQQHWGKNNSKVKTVWIDPTMVNPPK